MENRSLIENDALMHLVESLISDSDALASSSLAPPPFCDPLLADHPPDYPGPQTGASLPHNLPTPLNVVDPRPLGAPSAASQNSKLDATGSGKTNGLSDLFCCFQQNASPCLWCAFRLQDGDYTARCRRDVEIQSWGCIECVYAGRKCTWGGYEPDRDLGARLVEDRERATLMASGKGANSIEAQSAMHSMRSSAGAYLIRFWETADILDMYTAQCRHNLPTPKKKKRKLRGKGKDADKGSNKEADNAAEPMTTESYSRLVVQVAQIFLLRKVLKSNYEIAGVIERNHAALCKILVATQEEISRP